MINTTHTHTLTMIIIQYTYYLVTTRVSRKFEIMMNRFYTTNSDGKKMTVVPKLAPNYWSIGQHAEHAPKVNSERKPRTTLKETFRIMRRFLFSKKKVILYTNTI